MTKQSNKKSDKNETKEKQRESTIKTPKDKKEAAILRKEEMKRRPDPMFDADHMSDDDV